MSAKSTHEDKDNANPAPLTSGRLHDMVLDHMLENADLFILNENNQSNPVDHFQATMNSLVALAHQIAAESLVNRQCLSSIMTHDGKITANPDDQADDSQRYELRYRIVEQIGTEKPYKDSLLTYDEATDIYGESFIDNYWGRLGEHCPRKVTTTGDRTLWFTVVRFPSATLDQDAKNNQRQPSPSSPR